MSHPEFAPVAFISAFSLILPLPWHWRARNVATLSIIAWLFIVNIIYGVDALIWAGNVNIVATVWCDISTKLTIGANFALPAACLCVCMHLEQVASTRSARSALGDKRRRNYFEAFMCWGLPIVFMALHYVVQGHRFDIIENYGCRPATYFSIASIFIISIPPIVVATGALIFAGLALRHFMQRRLSFAAHLSSNSAFTTSRYLRLMAMAASQMVWSISLTIYALWFNLIAGPIRPWTTWSDVHSDWLRVDTFLEVFTPPFILKTFNVLWWVGPASSFLFVAFFAFGKDAVDEYKKCFSWFKTNVLRMPTTSSKTGFKKFMLSKNGLSPKISNPTLIASSHGGTDLNMLTSSSKEPSSPNSMFKSHAITDDYSAYDTVSEISHYPPPKPYYTIGKAIGSISDLSIYPPTPSTAVPPYDDVIHIKAETPPTPSLPPSDPVTRAERIRNLTLRTQPPLQQSPRPITYPSNDPTHENIHSSILYKS